MHDLRVLIAAAGRGSRAGLPYPKTLYPVQGKPILIRLCELMARWDDCPTVVVSPMGKAPIAACLASHCHEAHLVIQQRPRGMGDAVLRFAESPASHDADHVLLAWGDIPLIQPQTVEKLVAAHFDQDADFSFATRRVDSAYTRVVRGSDGEVTGLLESREAGIQEPRPGERDIGLFVFRKNLVLDALREEVPSRLGATTGEHGFLYLVGLLASRGHKLLALPIATELDLVSLNSLDDIKGHE